MSWHAHLDDDRGHEEGWWNYTHNCNRMANEVIAPQEVSWWKLLDGMDGPDGAALLSRIVDGLRADPEHFRAMNPENGWGNYDSFVALLDEMRRAVPEWPCSWEVHG